MRDVTLYRRLLAREFDAEDLPELLSGAVRRSHGRWSAGLPDRVFDGKVYKSVNRNVNRCTEMYIRPERIPQPHSPSHRSSALHDGWKTP